MSDQIGKLKEQVRLLTGELAEAEAEISRQNARQHRMRRAIIVLSERLRKARVPADRRWLKRTQARDELLLRLIRNGTSLSRACQRIGVTRQAVSYWRRKDPDFARRLEEARKEWRRTA